MTETTRAGVGQLFEIHLAGSPTTGFRWEFSPDPAAPVELVDQVVEPDLGSVGGPATQRFTFRARLPGRTRLKFAYKRPWEPRERDHREFDVLIAP